MGGVESTAAKTDPLERSALVPPAPEEDTVDIAARSVSPRSVNRFSAAATPAVRHRDVASEQGVPVLVDGAPTELAVTPPAPAQRERPMKMLVLMSDTGGGHRASAQALETAFHQMHGSQASVIIVDFWTSVAGFPFHNFPKQYTYLAKRPWLWYSVYLWAKFPPTRWLTEMAFALFCHSKVCRHFESVDADCIVSVHPLVNTLSLSVLGYIRRIRGCSTPPYVTVVTDLGGAHPTWFDKRSDLVYVPSEPLRDVAIEAGVSSDRIRMFGLPIRSSFWTESRSRDALRVELGMAIDLPAVLIVGGGDGVGGLRAIAMTMASRISTDVGDSAGQLVVICGKNKTLLNELQSQSWPVPVILKGFVTNMSEWMTACDVLCSKAGPGTIAEAWTRGLPVILTGFLPGQEEGNVRLVTESGSGEFHDTPESIAECAARWVGDPELRGAIAAKARELGRPNSTRQIAADIWDLTVKRADERDAFVVRPGLPMPSSSVPNGYVAMGRFYVNNGFRALQRSLPTMFGGRPDALLLRPQ